jgi:hypothetical protein
VTPPPPPMPAATAVSYTDPTGLFDIDVGQTIDDVTGTASDAFDGFVQWQSDAVCSFGDTLTLGATKAARKAISGASNCDSDSLPGYIGTGLALAVPIPGLQELDAARVGARGLEAATQGENAASRLGRRLGEESGEFDPLARLGKSSRGETKAERGDGREELRKAAQQVEKEGHAKQQGGSQWRRIVGNALKLLHPPQ